MSTAKTAYVTGGASGIGRAVVDMLSKRGVRVAIGDINLQGAQSVASSLQGGMAVELSVADWDSQLEAFQKVLKEFGRIDYVYAIAGISEKKWIPNDPSSVDFAKPNLATVEVDLNGILYTASLAIQQMRRQDPDETGVRGKIAAVASVCGFYIVPSMPLYCAAKHGVVGFVRSFGKYLPTEGITMNAICPDIVATGLSTDAFYQKVDEQGCLVPMHFVVEAFERCLDSNISGETLEIEPSGITHRSGPEPINQAAEASLKLVHDRVLPLHAPSKLA